MSVAITLKIGFHQKSLRIKSMRKLSQPSNKSMQLMKIIYSSYFRTKIHLTLNCNDMLDFLKCLS
jgi:hypothetical protein